MLADINKHFYVLYSFNRISELIEKLYYKNYIKQATIVLVIAQSCCEWMEKKEEKVQGTQKKIAKNMLIVLLFQFNIYFVKLLGSISV